MTESTHGSLNSRWFWSDPLQQNTCTPLQLSWLWQSTDTSATVELSITQILVPQLDPPSSSSVATASSTIGGGVTLAARQTASSTNTAGGTFQTSIVKSITANAESFLYESIAVPQGWYQIIAYAPDGSIDKRTSSFFVWNGTDISCLPTNSPSPSDSSTLPGSTSSSGSTPGSTSTGLPSGGSSSGSSSKAGPIAGGVVGGLVLIALLAALFFFCRKKRRQSVRGSIIGESSVSGSSSAGGHRKGGKWGGLSSVDSIDAAAAMASAARSAPNGAGALAMSDRRRPEDDFIDDDMEKGSPTNVSPFENEYTFTPDALGYQLPSTPSSRRPSATVRYSNTSELSGGVPLSPVGAISISPPNGNGFSNSYDRFGATPSPTPDTGNTSITTPSKPRRKPVPSYTPSTTSGIHGPPSIGVIPSVPPMQMSQSTSTGSSSNHAQQWGKDGKVHYLMPDLPPPTL
ncbi:hypothetical protein DL96DRAFT_1623003 [Flagelloscypha sp. PMI_526]|nr:hypothetical protein DL96DRAFT_1623003 [Flagelloscypha sp. PMI_526]